MAAGRRPLSRHYDLPTFCDHGPDHRTTKLHRYTACYLPELAARLIRRHSSPGQTVLDGFLGGGTTAIQAVGHGRQALGLDVHPAAVEIASARLAPVAPGLLAAILERMTRTLRGCRSGPVDLPEDPGGWEWQRWFPRASHPALALLRRMILDVPHRDVRRLLFVATAGGLKPVSYWYSHATKLQFDPDKKPAPVAATMIARLTEAAKINQDLWEHVGGRAGAHARRAAAMLQVGDCRALPFEDASVDLAVSSPPYFIAYDSAKLLRPSSWWILGHVPDGTGHVETAGRGRAVKNSSTSTLGTIFDRLQTRVARLASSEDCTHSTSHIRGLQRSLFPFFHGIRGALSEVFRVLRPGGKLCLVLGNTRHCGLVVRTAEITTELALLQGFRLAALHVRRQHSATQPQTRATTGRFTSDTALEQYSYRDEYVIVLRR